MEYEIERSFLDWTIEEVVKWLQTLSLSQNYSSHFKDHGITGSTLIKLNPAALDELGITEGGDRVKILQQLTTMRADLIPSRAISPVKRVHSPSTAKLRRYSEISRPAHNNRLHGRLMRQTLSTSSTTFDRSLPAPIRPSKFTTPIKEASPPNRISQQEGSGIVNPAGSNRSSRSRLSSMEHTSSDSLDSCRISSPTKSRGSSSPHYGLEDGGSSKEKGMESCGDSTEGVIQHDATFRSYTNNMRRLSRSLDGLYLDGEDCFSLVSEPVDHRESSCSGNSRLVEILREENATLKKELESYYNRVRKLQKLEREVERIREGHRLLEASASRKAKLEATMRDKLEQEIRKLKEDNIQQKAELKSTRKDSGTSGGDTAKGKSREIRRRDTMIMKLIKKNKDAAAVREQLEKDLEAAKAQLKARRASETTEQGDQEATEIGGKKSSTEIETSIALVYSESIEKLKGVLQAMQNASQKREKLEKQLREQLQSEISRLKESNTAAGADSAAGGGAGRTNSKQEKSELQQQILLLETEVAKWEHKCLELVAEKQMELETAVVPRDTRLAHLERSLAEKTDIMHELRQQRSMYLSQISDTNQRIAEMETRVASLQSTIREKDSLIQVLQQSFLDPDDYGSTCGSFTQDDQPLTSQLHHSPVSAKKFNLNGAVGGIGGGGPGRGGGNDTSPYDQLSLQIPPPPLPSFHHQQRFTNGAHAHASGRNLRYSENSASSPRGYPAVGELGYPIVKGYSNYSVPTSPVKAVQYDRSGSLSPVKRPNEIRGGAAKYYNLELTADDAMSNSGAYPPPYRGHSQLPIPGGSGGYSNGSTVTSGYNGGTPAQVASSPSSTHHHKLSVPTTSNSAPNSPSVRKVVQKPRISQPNIHHIQHAPQPPIPVPGNGTSGSAAARGNGGREQNLSSLTRLGSPPKYRNPKVVKSNTGDMKRNHIRPPVDMAIKSKTPPPNDKLEINQRQQPGGQSSKKVAVGIAVGGGSSVNGSHHHGNGHHGHLKPSPADHQKQRHHSVDDFLGSHHGEMTAERAQDRGIFDAAATNSPVVSLQLSTNSNNSSSLALFESLIGDSLPKTSSPLIGGCSVASRRHHNNMNSATHRHSQSSPTRELVHL